MEKPREKANGFSGSRYSWTSENGEPASKWINFFYSGVSRLGNVPQVTTKRNQSKAHARWSGRMAKLWARAKMSRWVRERREPRRKSGRGMGWSALLSPFRALYSSDSHPHRPPYPTLQTANTVLGPLRGRKQTSLRREILCFHFSSSRWPLWLRHICKTAAAKARLQRARLT